MSTVIPHCAFEPMGTNMDMKTHPMRKLRITEFTTEGLVPMTNQVSLLTTGMG